MGENAFKLGELVLGHGQVAMQLLHDKRVAEVAHPALDLHLVVGEVLARARRDPVLNLGDGVGEMRHHIATPVAPLKKAQEPAQLTANLLELQHRDIGHESLVGNRSEHGQLLLHLRDGGTLLQLHGNGDEPVHMVSHFVPVAKRAHEAVHERIETKCVHIGLVVAHERGHLARKHAQIALADAGVRGLLLVLLHRLPMQAH